MDTMVKRGGQRETGKRKWIYVDTDMDIDTALMLVQRGEEISEKRHKNVQQ